LVRGRWNDECLRVLENFPAGKHDDEVDALSGAHAILCKPSGGFTNETLALSSSGTQDDPTSYGSSITLEDYPPAW